MAFRKKKEEKVEEVETSKTEVQEVTDGRQAPPAAIQLNGSLPQDRHIVING